MSDYEDDYSYDCDYDSNNGSDDQATLILNKYYEAEDYKDSKNYKDALECLNEVISLEQDVDNKEYTLKSYIEMIKI